MVITHRAEEIGSDLSRVALTYSSAPNIQAAVECLARLASHICHHATHLLALAHKCFNAIAAAAREATALPANGFKYRVQPCQVYMCVV